MILYTGCDAWCRTRRQQSLAGGLGASLCALRLRCICTLVYEDSTQWSGPHMCGLLSLLWYKGISEYQFCKVCGLHNANISSMFWNCFKVFNSSQIWHWALCGMWPGFSEPVSNGRLLSFYFWVLSHSKPKIYIMFSRAPGWILSKNVLKVVTPILHNM